MAAWLKYNREGTFTETDINGVRSARVCATLHDFVPSTSTTALTFTSNQQAKIMAASLSGIIEGSAYPGELATTCACTSMRAQPVSNGPVFSIIWEFERPTFINAGAVNTLYYVDGQRTMVEVERVRLPHVASGKVLTVGWKDPDHSENIIEPQTATVQIRKMAKQVVLAGRFTTAPKYSDGTTMKLIEDAAGTINHDTYQGYPRGYWLFAGTFYHREPGSNLRTLQCVLLNMLDEDWSEYIVVRHPSGITPPLDITAVAGDYPGKDEGQTGGDHKGYIRPDNLHSTAPARDWSGLVRIGPFPEANFTQVFAALDTTP